MREIEIEVPGGVLRASDTGGADPAVVALHGLTQSRASDDRDGFFDWSPVAAAGRRLVRYDARGHGASTGRSRSEDWRWDALAGDLVAVLDAVSPDAPVDAIGVSMGTATLLHAAARRPERFRRLVLALPPTAWATRPAVRDQYEAAARLVEAHGVDAFARGVAAMPLPPAAAEAGAAQGPPDVPAALLPAVLRGAAASDLPDERAIAALSLPVLLLPWTGDPGHPMSTAEVLADLLPDAVLAPMRTGGDLRSAGDRAAAFLTA